MPKFNTLWHVGYIAKIRIILSYHFLKCVCFNIYVSRLHKSARGEHNILSHLYFCLFIYCTFSRLCNNSTMDSAVQSPHTMAVWETTGRGFPRPASALWVLEIFYLRFLCRNIQTEQAPLCLVFVCLTSCDYFFCNHKAFPEDRDSFRAKSTEAVGTGGTLGNRWQQRTAWAFLWGCLDTYMQAGVPHSILSRNWLVGPPLEGRLTCLSRWRWQQLDGEAQSWGAKMGSGVAAFIASEFVFS